jgi:hypothetical protein
MMRNIEQQNHHFSTNIDITKACVENCNEIPIHAIQFRVNHL